MKLFTILITFGQSISYVMSGMYGQPEDLGYFVCFLIGTQLFLTGFMVLMLDEMMSAGFGLGSGISLFIAVNISEDIVWKCFSPVTISSEGGTEFEGCIVAFYHFWMTKGDKLSALRAAFYR